MDTLMRQDSFNALYETISEKYTVEFNDEALMTMKEKESQESSAIEYQES